MIFVQVQKRRIQISFIISLFLLTMGFLSKSWATTITVNDLADNTTASDGNCTLREAITNANGDTDGTGGDCATGSGADVIQFDASLTGEITLSSELPITSDLTITGPGADQLRISGDGANRIFNNTTASSFSISGLSLIEGNSATNDGGAILNAASMILTIQDCNIYDNAGTNGGAIYNQGTLVISRSAIHNNSASGNGGGLYSSGNLDMKNSTVSKSLGGSGVYLVGSGTNKISHCTIAKNVNGGLYSTVATTVKNTIISHNTILPDVDGTITFASDGYNLIGGNAGSSADFNQTGDQVDVDSKLGGLQDNGGSTPTHGLLPGSPAIDSGVDTDIDSSPVNTDQRGEPRSYDNPDYTNGGGGAHDIGACEYQLEVDFAWCGAATPTTATVKARISAEGSAVNLILSQNNDLSSPDATILLTVVNNIVTAELTGLSPDTHYYYGLEIAGVVDDRKIGEFSTVPLEGPASFKFAFSCGDKNYSDHPVFAEIANTNPSFFINTGDLFYADITTNDQSLYRDAYHNILCSERQAALYRRVSMAYMWDDHDYADNNSDSTAVGREAARHVYQEYTPHYPLPAGTGNTPIYQAFTVGRVRFILTDLRSVSSPDANSTDAGNTKMGAAQKSWFKQELLNANRVYPIIVWVSSVTWIANENTAECTGSPYCDHWGGYDVERREIADFIKDNDIKGMVMLNGDAHMVTIDSGANSDYASGTGAAFPVMQAGALDQVGSLKGGPFSELTFLNDPNPTGSPPFDGQFGVMDITDNNGAQICFDWTGYNVDKDTHALSTLITQNFCISVPVTIGNFVWLDHNRDGVQGGGETGIDNIVVRLYDDSNVLQDTTLTDAQGKYQFLVDAGTYYLEVVKPGGYGFTTQDAAADGLDSDVDSSTGRTNPINFTSGTVDTTLDAGLTQDVMIGDFVWIDSDANGEFDSGTENALAGVTVQLYDQTGSTLIGSPVTTLSDGSYQIAVTPGSYRLKFEKAGYRVSPLIQTGDNSNHADPTTGMTSVFTASFGGTIDTLDVGMYETGEISGLVWHDKNYDGIQDTLEPGLNDITVYLFQDRDLDGIAEPTGDDSPSLSQIGTADHGGAGHYQFSSLDPGRYFIYLNPPETFLFSPQNQSTDDEDSDCDPDSGSTAVIVLIGGGTESDWDCGFYRIQDFGDAPSPYPTLLQDDGARHLISDSLRFGNSPADNDDIDSEMDGQPHALSQGDDADGNDDEHGVLDPNSLYLAEGGAVSIGLEIDNDFPQTAYVVGWIDYNQNRAWSVVHEQSNVQSISQGGGNINLTFPPVPNNPPDTTFMRIRLSSRNDLSSIGEAPDGEVEDYQVIINRKPTLISLSSDNVDEGQPAGTMVGILSATDPDTSDLHTFAIVTSGVPFSIQNGNELITTDMLDAQIYPIVIQATDNGTPFTQYEQTFSITVNGVNNPPVIWLNGEENSANWAAQQVNEDDSLAFFAANTNHISVSDPDAGSGSLSMTLTALHGDLSLVNTHGLDGYAGDNTSQLSLIGPIGSAIEGLNHALDGAIYQPDPDYNGVDTLVMYINDNGHSGPGVTSPQTDLDTLYMTIDPVNDAPSFTAIDPPGVLENSGEATITGWATFDAGPDDEDASQAALAYTVSNVGNTALFSVSPAVDANGNLTYTPALNLNGTSTYNVTVQDNGGISNSGVDTSYVQTFMITVNTSQSIPLLPPDQTSGWGWISSYIDPANPNITSIWSQIENMNIVQDLYGFYIPGLIDMLGNWNISTMYMVNAGGGTLQLVGSQIIPATTPIYLNQGWNWIAYYPVTSDSAHTALASIWNNLVYADDYGSGLCIPDNGINMLVMGPGQGYRVYVSEADTLIYPDGSSRGDAPELPVVTETVHFDFHESHYYYPVLFVDNSIEELDLAIGDEVALFAQRDGEPFCVGASVWQGEIPFTISGWANDPMTDEKDGYTAGEPILIRSWTATDDQESDLPVIFEDDHSTYESAIYSIASVDLDALGTDDDVASYEFMLEQNRPNPFNPCTTIQYEIPRASLVTLSIYNINGQLIRTLVNKKQSPGSHHVVWDAQNNTGRKVTSGVYFYRLETSDSSANKRMVLLR
ncbi:MAG: hypothetical protein B6244_12680 [Candidatus Cloacimonetes bacterium 4572_55]|nr:MAG: hypothetical protein B6244_12680 [Candidatus Cloacimonetes bacterium 4572_55]